MRRAGQQILHIFVKQDQGPWLTLNKECNCTLHSKLECNPNVPRGLKGQPSARAQNLGAF